MITAETKDTTPTDNKISLISRARVDVTDLSAFRNAINYSNSLALLVLTDKAPAQD
jgi:hypothetical protein